MKRNELEDLAARLSTEDLAAITLLKLERELAAVDEERARIVCTINALRGALPNCKNDTPRCDRQARQAKPKAAKRQGKAKKPAPKKREPKKPAPKRAKQEPGAPVVGSLSEAIRAVLKHGSKTALEIVADLAGTGVDLGAVPHRNVAIACARSPFFKKDEATGEYSLK